MREFCLTEEVIQQFLDNELSPEQTETVAAHLAACEPCSDLLGEVEQESAILMEAFAPELSLPVPSARLRERLDAAIADLEPKRGLAGAAQGARLRDWFTSLFGSLSFTPQRAMAFASLVVIIAFASIFAVTQLRHKEDAGQFVASKGSELQLAQPSSAEIQKAAPAEASAPDATYKGDGSQATNVPARVRAPKVRTFNNAMAKKENTPVTPPVEVNKPQLLPGEKGYLEAIASLSSVIEANKDDVLKPTVRADYERNLAVVDQAIVTTRQQAKLNPKDKDAAEFLYTAYQNKIELLSAVASQAMVASR